MLLLPRLLLLARINHIGNVFLSGSGWGCAGLAGTLGLLLGRERGRVCQRWRRASNSCRQETLLLRLLLLLVLLRQLLLHADGQSDVAAIVARLGTLSLQSPQLLRQRLR